MRSPIFSVHSLVLLSSLVVMERDTHLSVNLALFAQLQAGKWSTHKLALCLDTFLIKSSNFPVRSSVLLSPLLGMERGTH